MTPDVEAALDLVLQQMDTAAGLEKILEVGTRIVAGMDYDIDFQLDRRRRTIRSGSPLEARNLSALH